MNNDTTIPIDGQAISEVAAELSFVASNLYFLKNAIADELGRSEDRDVDNALYLPLRTLEADIEIIRALIEKGGAK